MNVREQLSEFLNSEAERVGFVLKSGEIVEVDNVCHDPANGFDVRGEDILRFARDAEATWHTHPGGDCNLSPNDYETFISWPELAHWIVAPNGVRRYVVNNGAVLVDAA